MTKNATVIVENKVVPLFMKHGVYINTAKMEIALT